MTPQTNHFNYQTGKLNRAFRLSAIHKGEGKWIRDELRHDWYYIFRYKDDGSLFALHKNYNDKIIEKLNHMETFNLLKD